MDKQFGLQFLLRTYLGIASNVVQPGRREERKSIGYERCVRHLTIVTGLNLMDDGD
jgi:DNA polymerase kappa